MKGDQNADNLLRAQLTELLIGGFAPVITLLREFHFEKAGILLEGLPFSAYSLLEHMRHRQHVLLKFMRNPADQLNVWPDAYWPESVEPENRQGWEDAIEAVEKDLEEIIESGDHPESLLLEDD